MKISAGILTGFVLTVGADTTCNTDGSVVYTFVSSGTEEIIDFDINDGTCGKDKKAKLTDVAGTGDITYTYTIENDCLKDDGTDRIVEIKNYYTKPNEDTEMYSKIVRFSAKCEIKSSYKVSLPLGDVKITEEDKGGDTDGSTDIGFAFAIDGYTDGSYSEVSSLAEVMTNTELFFMIKPTKATAGYKFDIPKCTVKRGDTDSYDLWKLSDNTYCVEDFAKTTVTKSSTDWKGKFEAFSFDKTGTGSYRIDCVINVCKSSVSGPCPGDDSSPAIDSACLSDDGVFTRAD